MASETPSDLTYSTATASAPWPVLISHPAEHSMLSLSEWLVTYQNGTPANDHSSEL